MGMPGILGLSIKGLTSVKQALTCEERHAPQGHWALRDEAAAVTSLVCTQFGPAFGEVQARVCRQLAGALADPGKPLATHYGGHLFLLL